jgi:prepilin-type N-terminal cleavage/methylation domain-containing protein
MRPNRAFTLIEVMLVLAILALVAILAYSFFGGVVGDTKTSKGATQRYNDLRVLSDCGEKHLIDTGEYLDEVDSADAYIKDISQLYSSVYLNAPLVPPQEIFDPNGTLAATYNYRLVDAIYANYGGPAGFDASFRLTDMTLDACQLFYDRYSSLGVGTAVPAAYTFEVGPHCWPSNGTQRRIIYLTDLR